MQAFLDTARVQLNNEGIYFYEQDVIMSYYRFSRDVKIDINLSYVRSGFGIVISEDSPVKSRHSYLYHLGTNRFSVYERYLLQQSETAERANILKPGCEAHLTFTLKNNRGRVYLTAESSDGEQRETLLGEYTIPRKMSTYYMGFYSQAGNIIKDVTFLQGIPERWHCSIANVHGGRISFWDDGFMFEDCIHDAELEQKEILLPAGTYWFDYETKEVNGIYDIEGFVYESYIPDLPSDINDTHYEKDRADFDEDWLEDKGKMLVHNQGSFTLTEETSVIVSFKGMHGRVNYICLKDTEHGDYISTDDKIKRIDGSWMTVDLTGVRAFKWEGIIFALPAYDDFTKPCPYAIMSTVTDLISPEALSVETGKQYNYYYDVAASRLEAVETESEQFNGYRSLALTSDDNNKVKVFVNMRAQITNFILIMNDGTEININLQKTYKTFVPGYIVGPIVVTDKDNNSFELSGSYREVIDQDNYKIDIFSQSALELKLTGHTSTLWQNLEVFGIPRGATVDDTQTDIDKFTNMYTIIEPDLFSFNDDIIKINPAVRDDYVYIAVRYQRSDSYSYVMTVYERELFNGTENILELSSDINESGQGITVYGIYEGSFKRDYLLRIPRRDMLETIDLCANRYDMISPTQYELDTYEGTIHLDTSLNDKYAYYVVDYMRQNSYAVNWNETAQQYEVDIASDEDTVLIHYEMTESGKSESIIRTDIKPDDNKFIILKRNKGAFIDED